MSEFIELNTIACANKQLLEISKVTFNRSLCPRLGHEPSTLMTVYFQPFRPSILDLTRPGFRLGHRFGHGLEHGLGPGRIFNFGLGFRHGHTILKNFGHGLGHGHGHTSDTRVRSSLVHGL